MNPGHCFNLKGVGTKSEVCQAADNILRKVKKYEPGKDVDMYHGRMSTCTWKDVWQMCDQGPLCREGAPLMISGVFAALLWMRIRIRCPVIQVPLPEVHDKATDINGLTLQQPFFEHVGLCQTIYSRLD